MGAVLTRGWWSRVRGSDAGGARRPSGQPRLVRAQDALPSPTLDFHLLVTEGASDAYFYFFYHNSFNSIFPLTKRLYPLDILAVISNRKWFKVVILGGFFIFQNIFVLLSKLLDSLPGYKIVG